MLAAAVLLAVALALAACGKLGPPQPPGPPDKVTWPHLYPAPHPAP
jgi:predicted small lipoprotein YifL